MDCCEVRTSVTRRGLLLGGQIDILIDTLTISAPQLAAGTIRGLGVTSEKPWFSIPDVPPIDAIVRGYEVRSWLGIATSKNMPQPVVDKLDRELRAVLEMPDIKGKLEAMAAGLDLQDCQTLPISDAENHRRPAAGRLEGLHRRRQHPQGHQPLSLAAGRRKADVSGL